MARTTTYTCDKCKGRIEKELQHNRRANSRFTKKGWHMMRAGLWIFPQVSRHPFIPKKKGDRVDLCLGCLIEAIVEEMREDYHDD